MRLVFFLFGLLNIIHSLSLMPPTQIRGIFFDVDGTLSDSWKLGFDSTQAVMKNAGYDLISEDSYHIGTKYSTPRRFAWHVTGDPEHEIGITLGQEFDRLYVDLVSPTTTALYPGIIPMLQKIKSSSNNIKIAALSNACGAYVSAVLQVNELNSFFDIGLGADEVPSPKPSPDGLLKLCQLTNTDPLYCIYIGDSPSDGIAAKAAGMRSIGKELTVYMYFYQLNNHQILHPFLTLS